MACLCGAEVRLGSDFCPEHQAEYRELLREFELMAVAQTFTARLSGIAVAAPPTDETG